MFLKAFQGKIPRSSPCVRHQPRSEHLVYAVLLGNEERATVSGGHRDRVGYDHLVCHRHMAVLQMGRHRSSAVFHLRVIGDSASTLDHLDELGTIMIHKMLPLSLLLLMGSFVMAEDTPQTLFDFTGADAAKEWQTVNDGVMGGVSEGKFKITRKKSLEFFGTLSLENNGGFASVRTKAKKLDLEKGDTVVAKIRGDGREYMLNLYLNKPLIAFSYRATVQTKADEWIEVKVPLDKFEATSFGRPVKDAGVVDPKEINAVGFMLRDKKAGPFKMEVESIKVERARK
jgi:NADH dehydrogenase [ubiquinone] 1 alpha subcomplex assembly factor 1